MENSADITELIGRTAYVDLYRDDAAQADRWHRLRSTFASNFGDAEVRYFSSPGRTELGGNHTDHNNGIVLAAAVNLDSIAVAAANAAGRVTVHSEGFADPFVVDLSELTPRTHEAGTTTAIIRGVASQLNELGYSIGGFDASVTSDVLIGSGLSSSASIEVLVGTIFNAFYNAATIDAVTIAKIGQFAENNYFGKPSGLMDQIACAVGGAVMIDFRHAATSVVSNINVTFSDEYELLVVNTGGSHADLTEEYASIPREMRLVAEALGKRNAREVDPDELKSQITRLRSVTGDRAILRTLHFLHENERVIRQAAALEKRNFNEFLRFVRESGDSSYKWLQNCLSSGASTVQSIPLALAVTEDFLLQVGAGACRVHGGGFAGTIQIWLPQKALGEYQHLMNGIFGEGSVVPLKIRSRGATEL